MARWRLGKRNEVALLRHEKIAWQRRKSIIKNCQRRRDIHADWGNAGRQMRSKITAHAIGRIFGDVMLVERHTDELNYKNTHRDIKRDPVKTVRAL